LTTILLIFKLISFGGNAHKSSPLIWITDEIFEVIMNIIAWAILGILAGAIAKAIYPGY
jgi:hypothetical protein